MVFYASFNENQFSNKLSNTLEKVKYQYDNYMILGDLNFDMLITNKSKQLVDICDLYDCCNLIKDPTCFVKNSKPSLVDVLLTNKSNIVLILLIFQTVLVIGII